MFSGHKELWINSILLRSKKDECRIRSYRPQKIHMSVIISTRIRLTRGLNMIALVFRNVALIVLWFVSPVRGYSQDCVGALHQLDYGTGSQDAFALSDGSLATWFRAAVNADGMKRAYHRDGLAGGGLISLCNAGRPYPAGRDPYNASAHNEACRRFSGDYQAIRNAGWKDPNVGAIHWFGVLGRDNVKIGERTVTQVVPIEQKDGSGFFVSPTALEDPEGYPDPLDQRRYVDAETVPAAVIRNAPALRELRVTKGTLGVAVHRKHLKPVPFLVGDYGPRIGEGTFALGRLLQGKPLVAATRKNIFSAHIEEKDVLWVFFAGEAMKPPYTALRVAAEAQASFEAWGGQARLLACLANDEIPVAQ